MALMSIVAEFQDVIGAAIPRVVALLNDRDLNIRIAVADSLSRLAEKGRISEFLV